VVAGGGRGIQPPVVAGGGRGIQPPVVAGGGRGIQKDRLGAHMADPKRDEPEEEQATASTPADDELEPSRSSRASVRQRIDYLRRERAEAMVAGGPDAIERQHARGKLSARERLELLLDPGSFVEIDALTRHRLGTYGLDRIRPYTDGVVTGWGTIDGRKVFVFSQDFTVFGGSLGEVMAEKVCKIMDLATSVGAPIIGINDSGGARIQEGAASLAGYGYIFDRNVRASGVVPQISVIMGPCAGGAVYSPAITDFVYMVRGTSYMFITGPDVIKTVTGEEVTFDELGGAETHASRSGIASFIAEDETNCLAQVRYLLSFLPQNNLEDPPSYPPTDDPLRRDESLNTLIPDSQRAPYDMKDVIRKVVDTGEFYEVFPRWALNILIGFARLDGHSIGIVANQPKVLAGTLDYESSEKAARFIRFCDAFNIPLVVFEDVPGFLPGTAQEYGGIIRRGAKLLYAFSEATVPKLTVITRKAYGGAYVVMNSKHLRADATFAWPTAEIAVMGSEGAVNVIFRREIQRADDQEQRRLELIGEYEEQFGNPYIAAERGYVDDVIEPAETRPKLIQSLRMLRTKREQVPPRKHGNIPL
jgi:acetyl-CoA carboxylase carboxyltransferase component